jgi:hypothetical protein
MSEGTSLLERARNAHQDHVEEIRVKAEAAADNLTTWLNGELADLLDAKGNDEIDGMTWGFPEDADLEVIVKSMGNQVPMTLETTLEGARVQALYTPTSAFGVAESVKFSVHARSEWLPFESLVQLGAALSR